MMDMLDLHGAGGGKGGGGKGKGKGKGGGGKGGGKGGGGGGGGAATSLAKCAMRVPCMYSDMPMCILSCAWRGHCTHAQVRDARARRGPYLDCLLITG